MKGIPMKNPADSKEEAMSSGATGTTGSGQNSAPKAAKGRSARSLKTKVAATAGGVGPSGSGKVHVEYLNPTAREVFIAGSFNGWDPRANALQAQGEGKWGVELSLQPGRYEYRLVVDGQWAEDPKASEFAANPYGGLNSVLQV